jgi:hypothetical protein
MKLDQQSSGAAALRAATAAERVAPTPEANRRFWLVSGMICFAYVWMLAFTPLSLFANWTVDDGMFVKVAGRFAAGQWFGASHPFDQSKMPGYILFLAAGSWLGLPVSIWHGITHAACAIAIGTFTLRMTRSPILGIVAVVSILTISYFYSVEGLRVVRDVIYSHIIILWFALFGLALFCTPERRGYVRMMAAAGGTFGLAWMMREEGVWLVPSLVALASLYYFMPIATRAHAFSLRDKVVPFAIAALVPMLIISSGNYLNYGYFGLAGQKETQFVRAMNALYSVESGEQVQYVAVPRKTRELIYAVSPAFRSIKDGIDPGPISTWQSGCSVYPSTCGDIPTAWFMWAMRTSVDLKGHFAAGTHIDFYRRLADEIETACAAGKLKCRGGLLSYVPPIQLSGVVRWPASFALGLKKAHVIDDSVDFTTQSCCALELPYALQVLNRPYVSPTEHEPAAMTADPRVATARLLRRGFQLLHTAAIFPLALAGMASFLWIGITAMRERTVPALGMFACILFAAAITRTLVISAVDVFMLGPVGMAGLYMAPAMYLFPLAYLFAVCVVWERLAGWAVTRRPIS